MHNRFLILTLITLLIAIAESASDIYAPCLPNICAYFSVDESQASLTMSLNLLGLAISGLLYGPLSDALGRRPIIIVGWALFVLASLMGAQASSLTELLIYRFLQGFGGGAALVIGLAMVSDLYQGAECAKMISRLGMVIALSPGLGPVLGSMIAANYPWHMVFWFVFIVSGLVGMMALFFLDETKPAHESRPFHIKPLIKSYQRLIGNRVYGSYAFIHILTITWLWGELANLPFIFMEGMDLPVAHYGYFMAFSVSVYVLGTIVNQRWVGRWGVKRMLQSGIILSALSGLMLCLGQGFTDLTPGMVLLLKIPGSFGIALIFGNATAQSLEHAGTDRGAGSALISGCQMLAGSLGIYGVSYFYNGTILPLALTVTICSLGALGIFTKVSKHA